MFDRWRTILTPGAPRENGGPRGVERVNGAMTAAAAAPQLAAEMRHSNGLDQFFASIQDRNDLSILDFTGANQANISFITSLGHKLYSDDILRSLDSAFGEGDFFANQSDKRRVEQFVAQSLEFPGHYFNGALVWDTLQFLASPLLQYTVDRLHEILQPDSYLLAFFHSDEKAGTIPVYTYRIADSRTLKLSRRGHRAPAQFFNNRSLEKLFHKFASVKFFLTRDHLREVIVKR